jgi:hypothetical protein
MRSFSAIATLEGAAHLENRDKMKIVAVIADAQKSLPAPDSQPSSDSSKRAFDSMIIGSAV